MDPTKASVAKLAGTSNYQVWAIKMKSYLIAQDLWEVIELKSSSITDRNIKSLNSKAISLIILSCEDHIIKLLNPDDLAATAWKKLEKQYGHIGFSARHLAFQSLVSTNISSCDSIDHFIDQFRTNMNTLSQMTTSTLPQWLLLSIFINNVSSQYEAWTQSVMQQVRSKSISEDSRTYLEEVIASLIDEARRTSQNGNSGDAGNTALTVRKPSKPKPICKYCGKIHKSENCWQEFPEKKPSARLSAAKTNDNSEPQQLSYSPSNIAFYSHNVQNRCDIWILDSGASQHMCNNKTQFSNFTTFSTTITIANNTTMNATGRGDVELMTQNGTPFKLLNVLYVPQLASNLLSVCCATRTPNMRFNFINGACEILYHNKILAVAKQKDSLLVLETIRPTAHAAISPNTLTWHKRLGHVNSDYMSKDPLKSSIGSVEKFTCETCLKNKSTRNISRNPVIKANRILEKVHSDLAGPITPTSLGGSKYVVTFTDDFSRFSWVFPCNEKSKCLEIFKVFKKAVETEFNQKIAFLHCDNGGEYTSKEWKLFSQQEGFQIRYTVPYTPEQNGVAERLNRTLFNTTRCFLNDNPSLVKSLWAELVRTACYIKNRLPCSANQNFKSPYEMLFDKQPSIEHLRVIGSKCYSHNTGRISGKLDERATQCILVGYESDNIYRVYDSISHKVIRSRDLVIQENTQPDQSQQRPSDQTASDNNNLPGELNSSEIEFEIKNQSDISPSPTIPKRSHVNTETSPSLNQYHTANTFQSPVHDTSKEYSLDELADPQYTNYPYKNPYMHRAFVSSCLMAADSVDSFIPESLEQAMHCTRSSSWAASMRDEIKSIIDCSTWKLVPAPKDTSDVIQGRWVFRTKCDVNGKLLKYKSRWVVRGFQQKAGTNVTDTYASVVKPMSYKVLFSLAASLDLDIEQMDVKTAFLNSPIEEDVYVEQPHGFEITSSNESKLLHKELFGQKLDVADRSFVFPRPKRSNAKLVCKLDKALYGLKQAPRAWYKTLASFMAFAKLQPLQSDYAVFANESRTLLVAVYVDDLLIFGKDKNDIQDIKSQLHNRFQMTDMGPAHLYLGMQITRDRKHRTLLLNQKKYIQIVLERFNMTECNPVSTPMETGLKLIHRVDKASPTEINQYQKLMGCLEYAAMATRPDITFSVHKLAQFASNPDISHLNAAKRILRYLKGSLSFCLVFSGGNKDKFELLGYTDADWAGDTTDRKSIGGYCFYLNQCLISHMSKKQATVALSTAEAEMHAALQAAKEAIWLRNLLSEIGYKQKQATTIYCDNQAAIALSRNPEFHSRSKHVDIHYQFLRLHIDRNTVNLKFIGSKEMAADGLTKALSRQNHIRFCEYMEGKHLPSDN